MNIKRIGACNIVGFLYFNLRKRFLVIFQFIFFRYFGEAFYVISIVILNKVIRFLRLVVCFQRAMVSNCIDNIG